MFSNAELGRATGGNLALLDPYLLFGDPAMPLHLPSSPAEVAGLRFSFLDHPYAARGVVDAVVNPGAAGWVGVGFAVDRGKIYPDLVAFGPFYRNVAGLHLTPGGAVAEIRTPADEAGPPPAGLLGSPFALDAAFHVACVWGQRFAGIVAFPVAVDRRRIVAATRPVPPPTSSTRPAAGSSNRLRSRSGCGEAKTRS